MIYRAEAVGLTISNDTKYDFCEFVKFRAISWKLFSYLYIILRDCNKSVPIVS